MCVQDWVKGESVRVSKTKTLVTYLRTQRVPVEAVGGLVFKPTTIKGDEDLPQKHLPFQGP